MVCVWVQGSHACGCREVMHKCREAIHGYGTWARVYFYILPILLMFFSSFFFFTSGSFQGYYGYSWWTFRGMGGTNFKERDLLTICCLFPIFVKALHWVVLSCWVMGNRYSCKNMLVNYSLKRNTITQFKNTTLYITTIYSYL